MLTKAAALLLFFLSYPAWTASWFFAPAAASQSPEDASGLTFHSLDDYDDLDGFLIGDEGWYWFKTQIAVEPGNDSLLLSGTDLGWEVWLAGENSIGSGSGPPWWYPSSQIPQLVKLAPGTEGELTVLMKSYVRTAYTSLPGAVVQGIESELKQYQLIGALQDPGIPAMAVVLGILLFIGGLAAAASRTRKSDLVFAFFGISVALLSVESVLTSIPGILSLIPWLIPALVTRIALPFAICFWRRAIASNSLKGHPIFNTVDFFITSIISLWLIIPLLGFPFMPLRSIGILSFNIWPWFLLLNVAGAFSFWVYQSSANRPGRIGSLLIFLAAIIPALFVYLKSGSNARWEYIVVAWGLPASLLISIPVFMSQKGVRKNKRAKPEEELEELEDLEDLLETSPVSAPPGEETVEKSLLAQSIRSSLFPDAIPWDPVWDLASARQGARHPATGFHDIYLNEGKYLSGFSFMDTGADSLESLVFAHLVKSELTSCFSPGNSLPGIARTVHRKIIAAAAAAEKTMKGVIGRFSGDKLVFIPLSNPPLMLRRTSNAKVISLVPTEGRTNNAPLGSRQFGVQGLRTMSVSMNSGDVIMIYTPSIVEIRSPAGEAMGPGRLAGALKMSRGRKADEIVANIIGEIKDFSGSDNIPVPLQILVIKKR